MSEVHTVMQPKAEESTSATMVGELRYSAITFYVDMTKPRGLVIPIGVMAEISLPTVYALGLIARTELSTEELACVSELTKPMVIKPFLYLASQFKEAWTTLAPGTALNGVAEKHAYSALHFSVPEPSEFYLPAALAGKTNIRNFLGTLLDEQMQKLLSLVNEPIRMPQPQTSLQEELLHLKAKAAAA